MSVIIRLQNLPWSANALDIRQFFHGLSIPEGGVHIVGGEQGDAFIAFSTDEDARQAFSRNNGKIKGIQIGLMLSSRTEMQKVIETARAQSYAAFMQTSAPSAPLPAAVPAIVPAPVPDLKKSSSKDSKDAKRDRKRSRSRSRDRKDRDRRDRRHRDRSRSRSRDRRDRRKRDRSRSRGRSKSRDRDRKSRDRKRSQESQQQKDKKPEVWAAPAAGIASNPMLAAMPLGGLDDARQNLSALSQQVLANSINGRNSVFGADMGQPGGGGMQSRNSWPPMQNNNMGMGDTMQNNFMRNDLGGMPLHQGPTSNNNLQSPVMPNGRRFLPNNDNTFQQRGQVPQCCIKMKPFYGGYSDIRRFFQGSFITNVGIKCINDEYGQRTGVVYVQFGNQHSKQEALRKNGEALNGIKMEIAHLDDDEFQTAVDRFQPEHFHSPNGDDQRKFRTRNITKYFNNTPSEPELKVFACLRVEDLPTYVKEQDILKMFSNRPLISLFLTARSRGGHVGYVKFGSTDEAKLALEDKGTHIVEGKAVTVKPCGDEEFDAISQQHEMGMDGGKESPPIQPIDTDCLNITSLPLQTNNMEIADFFTDIGVRPTKIHLMSNRMGFTGEAFCEFNKMEEASKAVTKDGANFGLNQVSIRPIHRDEMEHIILQNQAPPCIPQHNMRPNMMMNPMNNTRNFFQRNNSYDQMGRGGRFLGPRGPPRQRFMGGPGPADDAMPGCTVFMDNVPYKAGTNEILDFFDGYDITNNVSRRFNPNNTPSAEAKVIFNSPEEAFRAVQEKSGHKIWDRPIYLKQV